MITVNRIGDSITGSVNGKKFGVAFSQERYDALLELEARANNAETVVELNGIYDEAEPLTKESYLETKAVEGCQYIHVNTATGKFYLKQDSKVSNVEMPKSFVDRILTSVEKGIDIMPLIKFWTRLLRNPKLTPVKINRICNYIAKTYVDREYASELVADHGVSNEVATERATGLQTPITQEGLLVTYKVSNEIVHKYELDEEGNRTRVDRYEAKKSINDITGEISVDSDGKPEFVEDRIFEPAVMGQRGDEFTCSTADGVTVGHVIRVGAKHSLESWDQVNCNDNTSCVPGLHVGNLDYIRGYQGGNTVTHNTFVDPMYIGAVTDDGSGALRVKEYFTHSSMAGVNRSIYHSSKYAAMTDADWKVMREEAIKANQAKLEAEAAKFAADLAD